MCALRLYDLYKYLFSDENRKNKLSKGYLEECKFKIKKNKIYRFVDAEPEELDFGCDSE